MTMTSRLFTIVVAALVTGCTSGASPGSDSRTALALEDGDELRLFFADGPQSCASPDMVWVVGPDCDSPSWQLVVPVPSDLDAGAPYDVNTAPDEPRDGIQFGMQQGGCHSGEPVVHSGFVTLGAQQEGEIEVELEVVAGSSFDPSGTYRALVCE
jgi:hypothetical protein